MARMTYRDLGQAIDRMRLKDPEDFFRTPEVNDTLYAVTDLLVDFFRSNDPSFSENEFIGGTYGA